MSIAELLNALATVRRVGDGLAGDMSLAAAHSDSRRIGPGDLFIALPGQRSQGTDYLEAAFAAGAAAALISHDQAADVPERFRDRCISVDGIRRNAALAAAAIYDHPAEAMTCFGVTGTNGKTSTCHILREILRAAGHRVVMLTTVAREFGDWREVTENTTPDAAMLQAALHRARSGGATAAVIEVSAHGVVLDRITGCRFDALVFTNLARDHQDFFDGMEAYYAAKRRLFTDGAYHKPGCAAAIGTGDEWGRRLLTDCGLPRLGCGEGATGVDTAGLGLTPEGIRGWLAVHDRRFEVETTLTSSYNRLNLAGAVAACVLAGVPDTAIATALRQAIAVPGRLAAVPSAAPFRVIVDFAHTDAAMRNLLAGLRPECDGRLIVVFGAGGDKDPARRRTLPEAVFELADLGVITLDNPRSEPPQAIIDAMVGHWRELAGDDPDAARLMVEPDRSRAIGMALESARPGDIVVLAGKGHETTQIFADRVEHHDDRAVAAAWLERHYPWPAPVE